MSVNKNKTKVLMIGPNAQGGISSVIKMYKDYGLSENSDVEFLASYKGSNAFKRLFVFVFFLFEYFWTLLTNKDIELVHIHSASEGSFYRKYFVYKFAKIFHKKIIFHIHCPAFCRIYKESSKCIKKRTEEVINGSDLVLVLAQYWKDVTFDTFKNKNIKILYNPAVAKDTNKIAHEKLNVLFMGRFGKRKGVYDIIEAAKYIQNNDVVINLYGDGDIEEFQKLINDNNVQEKVKIKGWISGDKKDEAFRTADIYILPSYNEGLPMSVLEALSYGLPVISTPVGGTPETIEEGANGFLIPPGDAKALAEKINLIANDKNLRAKMGQESYRIAKEKFDIHVIVKQLREIYDELIK